MRNVDTSFHALQGVFPTRWRSWKQRPFLEGGGGQRLTTARPVEESVSPSHPLPVESYCLGKGDKFPEGSVEVNSFGSRMTSLHKTGSSFRRSSSFWAVDLVLLYEEIEGGERAETGEGNGA